MALRLSLLAIATLTAVASAQTAVLPNGYAAVEGNSSSAYPFGRGNSACRVQYIYDTAGMIAAGMAGPLSINTIAWRANTAAVVAGGTHAGAGVTLKIGPCAFDHLAVTNTFNTNFASSTTFNLNPVAVATGAGTTPNNYTTTLTVPGGFLFDPSAGTDLVIEISFPAGTFTGLAANTTASSMDLQSSVGVGGSRLFATTDTAATATPQLNLAAVIELGYSPAVGAASNLGYGVGCGAAYASFHQDFLLPAPASAALSNTSVSLTNVGTSYFVTNGGGTYVPPSITATSLALVDDNEVAVALSAAMPYPGGSTSSLTVCSNGFVSVATGNGTNWVPTASEMLAMPQTVWAPCWHDWNPAEAGSGQIKFEEIAGIAYITWDNVESYAGAPTVNPGTMQIQFNVATGDVKYVYGLLSAVGGGTGDPTLVGYSPAGPSAEPGSMDLATGLPLTLAAGDVLALALGAAPRPIINTTVTYTVSNINPAALLSVHIISLGGVDPGLSLTGIGMPGCWQYVDLSIASTFLLFGGPTATNTFAVPNDASMTGLPLDNQAASLVPGINALGAVTSNAVVSTIGIL